jgi:hypothetical protein
VIIVSILLRLIALGNLFGFGVFSPMLFELSEAGDVILVVIALKSDVAVNTDERCRSTPAKRVLFGLFLFQSGITVRADEGHHLVEVYL